MQTIRTCSFVHDNFWGLHSTSQISKWLSQSPSWRTTSTSTCLKTNQWGLAISPPVLRFHLHPKKASTAAEALWPQQRLRSPPSQQGHTRSSTKAAGTSPTRSLGSENSALNNNSTNRQSVLSASITFGVIIRLTTFVLDGLQDSPRPDPLDASGAGAPSEETGRLCDSTRTGRSSRGACPEQ